SQQARAASPQANRRQPAPPDQFIATGDFGLQSFYHDRAGMIVYGKTQPEHTVAARLEQLLVNQPPAALGSADQFLEQSAQLGQAALPGAFQDGFQALNHTQSSARSAAASCGS